MGVPRLFLRATLILFFVFSAFFLWGRDLEVKDVEFRSVYREKLNPPKLDHRFSYLRLIHPVPPHIPEFVSVPSPFLIYPPENAGADPSLFGSQVSKFDDEGRLRKAINALKLKNLKEATQTLLELAREKNDTGLHALVWLSWLSLNQNRGDEIPRFSEPLKKAENPFLAGQGFAYESFHHLETGENRRVLELMEEWDRSRGSEKPPYKLLFNALIAALRLEEFNLAESHSFKLEKTFPYAARLPVVLNVGADLAARGEEYDRALSLYSRVLDSFPGDSGNIRIRYKTAWIHYAKKDFEKSGRILGETDFEAFSIPKDELNYLKMLLALNDSNLKEAQSLFSSIGKTSEWRKHAAEFLLQYPEAYQGDASAVEEVLGYEYEKPLSLSLARLEKAALEIRADNAENAELLYLKIIETNGDSTPGLYAQFNYAQLLLVKNEPANTDEMLNRPFSTTNEEWLRKYHLYYSFFAQQKWEELLNLHAEINLKGRDADSSAELNLMIAIALARLERIDEAFELSLSAWKQHRKIQPLAFAVHLKYLQNEFEQALTLAEELKEAPNAYFLQYRVKSAIAAGKTAQALAYLKPHRQTQDPEIRLLWVEVWQADNHNREIIRNVPVWIEQTKDERLKARYLTVLADAHYNAKNFAEAEKLYGRLIQSPNAANRENAYLSLLTVRKLNGDLASFRQTGNQILKSDISDETRFKVLTMLATEARERKDYKTADRYYSEYLKFFQHEANQIRLSRSEMLYEAGSDKTCVKQTEKPWKDENAFASVDRILIGAKCALRTGNLKTANAIIDQDSAKLNPDYRKEDRSLIKAEAEYRNGKYEKSLEILKSIEAKNPSGEIAKKKKLYATLNQAALSRWEEILKTPDIERTFAQTPHSTTVVLIKARAYWETQKPKQAVSLVTRAVYNTQSEKDRSLLRLSLTDYLLAEGNRDLAQRIFTQIKPDLLDRLGEKNFYQALGKKLEN